MDKDDAVMAGPEEERTKPHILAESTDERSASSGSGKNSDLQMPRAEMLDLARKAAEVVVDRIENLPGETAWEGEFRQVLEVSTAERICTGSAA